MTGQYGQMSCKRRISNLQFYLFLSWGEESTTRAPHPPIPMQLLNRHSPPGSRRQISIGISPQIILKASKRGNSKSGPDKAKS